MRGDDNTGSLHALARGDGPPISFPWKITMQRSRMPEVETPPNHVLLDALSEATFCVLPVSLFPPTPPKCQIMFASSTHDVGTLNRL